STAQAKHRFGANQFSAPLKEARIFSPINAFRSNASV
ncbi:MAG: hypothetical protein ACI9LY_002886, partial [Arenicella sp.]